MRAQLRRGRGSFDPSVRFGNLAFDTQARTFTLSEAPLHLTAREHAVLETLILRAGRPVQKTVLAENIFGFDDETNPNALEICIHRVRKKLEGSGMAITTLRGLGYALKIDDGH